MSYALALAFGVAIGIVLGALGGGGAILTVPVLVYALGQTPTDATTGSLVIVGLTSAVAVIGRARAGQVSWRAGLAFAALGLGATFAGTAVNRRVDEQWLLVGFAVVMIAAGVAMLLKSRERAPQPDPTAHEGGRGRGAALVVKAGAAGLGVGFLTGLFGVGGGFAIVPALTLLLGMPIAVATGTSLLVIALNSASSLVARAGDLSVDWTVVVPFTVAAMAGSAVGRRVAGRLPGRVLQRAFAVLLLAVAAFVLVESAIAWR